MLRQAQPYLDDDGFTERVLGALPPRRSPRARVRVLVGSGLAALAAFALGPVRSLWVDALGVAPGAQLWALAALLLLCALVACGTGLSALLREVEG